MKALLLPTAAALVASLLPAQVQDGERARLELERTQRQLQQNRSEVDRLMELRLRHDLGLPADEGERTFQPPATPGTEAVERMRQDLREEDAATASLLDQYNRLRAQVEQLRADAEARAKKNAEAPFVLVPTAGSRQQPSATPRVGGAGMPTGPAEPSPPQPAGETAPVAAPALPTAAPLDRVKSQIAGSTDHQLVAQALFKAGQQQMDDAVRALELGHAELGKQLAERGRESLTRALAELAPLLEQKQPPYASLFYQGRCLELLFRHAERYEGLSLQSNAGEYQRREQQVRDAFLRITVRDVRKTGERGDVEVLGAWGLAAQTAMKHFAWMNQNAGYDQTARIAGLTWPGEKDQ
ncbi:MAG: hypothetical protein U1F60_11920 [Planctomycetota bacterium]